MWGVFLVNSVLLPLLTDAAVSPVSKNINRTPLSYRCPQPDTPKQLCPSAHSRDPAKYSCNRLWCDTGTDKTLTASCTEGANAGFPVHLWVHTGDPSLFPGTGTGHDHGEPLMLTALSLNTLIYRIHIYKCFHRFIIPINTISPKLV